MRPRWARRAAGIPFLVGLLCLLLATDVLALTWGPTTYLTTSRNAVLSERAIVASGATVHLACEEARGGVRRTWYRRSTDAAVTWKAPVQLSTPTAAWASNATLAISGAKVEVAWLEEDAASHWWVRFRRSLDGGATWSAATTLSSSLENPGPARLVHDAANRVLATWTDNNTGAVRVRRSLDGGATWGTAIKVATTTSKPDGYLEAFPVLASGGSTTYLAYYATLSQLVLRRSSNGGATWTAAFTIDAVGSAYLPDVAATSTSVVVGFARYEKGHLHIAIRRSGDSGAHWAATKIIGATTGAWSYQPVVTQGGGVYRMVYEQELDVQGLASAVYYRQSTDGGVTWSAATRLSASKRPHAGPGGAALAGTRTVVAWYDINPELLDSDVVVRTGG